VPFFLFLLGQLLILFQNHSEFAEWFLVLIASLTFCSLVGTSVACGVGPSVTTSSTQISFGRLVFWNLFEFSVAKITVSHILNPNPTR
jgi:hypothetical protein